MHDFGEELEGQSDAGLRLVAGKTLLFSFVPLLIAVAAGVLAAFIPVVASILAFLGYYFVCALVLFLSLGRVKSVRRLALSSWRRAFFFLLVIPAAAAAGLFVLLDDRVADAGLRVVFVILGCFALFLLLIALYAALTAYLMVRKIMRAARETVDALTQGLDR